MQAGSESGGIEKFSSAANASSTSQRPSLTGALRMATLHCIVGFNSLIGGDFPTSPKPTVPSRGGALDPGEYVIRAWQGVPSLDYWASRGRDRGTQPWRRSRWPTPTSKISSCVFGPPTDLSGRVEYEVGTAEPHAAVRRLRIAVVDGMNGGGAGPLHRGRALYSQPPPPWTV